MTIVAGTVIVATGCVSFPKLGLRRFAGTALAAELRTPPIPDLDVAYNLRLVGDDPIDSVLSISTSVARATHAEKAEERMRKTLELVNVP